MEVREIGEDRKHSPAPVAHRHLNVELIDLEILRLKWTRTEAALRLGISRPTLNKIYENKNVHNDVIIKIRDGFKKVGVDIPLERLVVWTANGKDETA